MIDRTLNGKAFKVLNIIDEYTGECLATLVNRKINADDIIDQLFNLSVFRSIPGHIRSDNGFIEAFNSRLRQEYMNESRFLSLENARERVESWHQQYNNEGPLRALGNLAPLEYALTMVKVA